MSKGIYVYYDKKLGYNVYVGQDSHIHEDKRHKDHNWKSNRRAQRINQVVQNNPERYVYKRLCEYPDDANVDLSALEKEFIALFKTHKYENKDRKVFNFTPGGENYLMSENSPNTKKYARITGRSRAYKLKIPGKNQKQSVDIFKLLNIFHDEHPDDFVCVETDAIDVGKIFGKKMSESKRRKNHPNYRGCKSYPRITGPDKFGIYYLNMPNGFRKSSRDIFKLINIFKLTNILNGEDSDEFVCIETDVIDVREVKTKYNKSNHLTIKYQINGDYDIIWDGKQIKNSKSKIFLKHLCLDMK